MVQTNSYSVNNLWYSEAWKIQERAWWVKLHARCRIKVFTRKFMTIHQSCRFFTKSWDKSFVFIFRPLLSKLFSITFAALQNIKPQLLKLESYWYKYYLQKNMRSLFPVTERWSAYNYNNFDLNAELTKNVRLHAAWNLDVRWCSGLTDQAVIINSNLTAKHKEQAHAQRNILERRRKIRKWKFKCLITWLLPLHKYFPLYFDVWCTKHFPGVFITRQSWKLFLRSQPLTADRRCISTGGADKKILKDWMRKYFNWLNERLNQLNIWRKTQAMSRNKGHEWEENMTWHLGNITSMTQHIYYYNPQCVHNSCINDVPT